MKTFDKKLSLLLSDFGYVVFGGTLFSKGIKGFTSQRKVVSIGSLFEACEYLIPIICNDSFTSRLRSI